MNITEKAAEILVDCGYADYKTDNGNYVCWHYSDVDNTVEAVQFLADNINGRRQADAIDDWIYENHPDIHSQMFADGEIYKTENLKKSEWRMRNIAYCLEKLL